MIAPAEIERFWREFFCLCEVSDFISLWGRLFRANAIKMPAVEAAGGVKQDFIYFVAIAGNFSLQLSGILICNFRQF